MGRGKGWTGGGVGECGPGWICVRKRAGSARTHLQTRRPRRSSPAWCLAEHPSLAVPLHLRSPLSSSPHPMFIPSLPVRRLGLPRNAHGASSSNVPSPAALSIAPYSHHDTSPLLSSPWFYPTHRMNHLVCTTFRAYHYTLKTPQSTAPPPTRPRPHPRPFAVELFQYSARPPM